VVHRPVGAERVEVSGVEQLAVVADRAVGVGQEALDDRDGLVRATDGL
jgi:hypothetical protein